MQATIGSEISISLFFAAQSINRTQPLKLIFNVLIFSVSKQRKGWNLELPQLRWWRVGIGPLEARQPLHLLLSPIRFSLLPLPKLAQGSLQSFSSIKNNKIAREKYITFLFPFPSLPVPQGKYIFKNKNKNKALKAGPHKWALRVIHTSGPKSTSHLDLKPGPRAVY